MPFFLTDAPIVRNSFDTAELFLTAGSAAAGVCVLLNARTECSFLERKAGTMMSLSYNDAEDEEEDEDEEEEDKDDEDEEDGERLVSFLLSVFRAAAANGLKEGVAVDVSFRRLFKSNPMLMTDNVDDDDELLGCLTSALLLLLDDVGRGVLGGPQAPLLRLLPGSCGTATGGAGRPGPVLWHHGSSSSTRTSPCSVCQ